MFAPLTRDALLDRLAAGDTLLLPTPRAAAQLRQQAVAALTPGTAEPASALAWPQWTTTLWSGLILEGVEPRLLLNPAQEHALWREIVTETASEALGSSALTSPDSLATLASSAWRLAAQYNALPRLRATANTHDQRIFADWADAFTRRCAQHNYLSLALLEHALQQHLEAHTLTAPKTLTLIGFLENTPAQQQLLNSLRTHGTEIRIHSLTTASCIQQHASTILPTEREELNFAARWSRTRLEADPTASIAIFAPDLPGIRADLEDTLRETLTPELQSIHTDLAATPWQFPSGPALATLPLLADALRLAHWAAHPLPLDAVTALLLSPYLAQNATEPHRSRSARFDAAILRRAPTLRDEIRLPWLLQLAQQNSTRLGDPAPSILTALHDLQTTLLRNDVLRPRTYADWTEFLRDLTRAMLWPGNRPLNATDFAATQSWDTLLDTLATLDFAGRRIPYTTFLAELDRQATSTAFRPPFAHAPLQIFSIAESTGCTFDAVLFLRATDAHWPPPEHIHPLLAWPLQRQLRMPGTDPTLTAARARAFTADLLQRSPKVLFTHASEDADGKLRPSSLLDGLPQLAAEDLAPAPPLAPPVALEAYEDDSILPAIPSPEIPGGSAVLKLQAACGFLAFAELRLRASELDTPELGLDAGESGTLLHKTLQNFWKRVETQDNLRNLSTNDRVQILRDCIDASLPHRIRPEGPWDLAYLTVQKDRLITVLLPWLDIELTRSTFEVRAIETAQQVTVGPLTLDVRLDRLDQIPGLPGEPAGFVLVDYKTGLSGSPRDWDTARPADPQLPLYALLHEPAELKGLAFAKVRAGKDMKWHGLQTEANILPSPRSNPLVELGYLVEEWRHTLTHLAEDFAAGDARVRPRDFRIDCARCAQRLLCRVDFTALDPLPTPDDQEAPQENSEEIHA
jgi:ATP-dependent helicase/nuclease subunit B